jgi:hypothetical protein
LEVDRGTPSVRTKKGYCMSLLIEKKPLIDR